MIKFPVGYTNGDSVIWLEADGRKTVDSWGHMVSFPETIDLKVTDYCDAGCHFCHEGSTVKGKHADLHAVRSMLQAFPYGVELAIGGGNPLAWPGLDQFLDWASQDFICNITVNALHARQKPSYERLVELQQRGWIHGIGISASSYGFGIGNFMPGLGNLKNVTGHVIPGLWGDWISSNAVNSLEHEHSMESIRAEMEGRSYKGYLDRYLILGYKFFRRGEKKHPEMILENIEAFKKHQVKIYSYLKHLGVTVSFDNLALEQLGIKQLIKPEEWDRLFMGEDGTRSMFIDAVEQTAAVSSIAPLSSRVAWIQKHPLTMFREKMSRKTELTEFIPATKARQRSIRVEALNKKKAFITEWLRIREEIEKAIDEGCTSILMPHRSSAEIVGTLIEWGYSVDAGVSGQQTIHW